MSQLATHSNVRDVDYVGIDKEFAESHPETELAGDDDYRDFMFAATPDVPAHESMVSGHTTIQETGSTKSVLLATLVLVGLCAVVAAVFIHPTVNNLANVMLQKAGIFYSISLIGIK